MASNQWSNHWTELTNVLSVICKMHESGINTHSLFLLQTGWRIGVILQCIMTTKGKAIRFFFGLFVPQVKEEVATDDEERTQLQIRNSSWHKSLSSASFSMGAGEKLCSRRANQQLPRPSPSRASDEVPKWECWRTQGNGVSDRVSQHHSSYFNEEPKARKNEVTCRKYLSKAVSPAVL